MINPQNPRRFAGNDLTIQVDSISLVKCEEPNELFYEEVIPTMLELMQPNPSIKHLRFVNLIDFRWWASDIRIDSVEAVTLYEHPSRTSDAPVRPPTCHLGFASSSHITCLQTLKQGRLASLQPFLSMFPSLRNLRFSGLGLLTDENDAPPPIAPDSSSTFIQQERRLASLLASLRDTRVEEVRYRLTVKGDRELRIRRARPTEEFGGRVVERVASTGHDVTRCTILFSVHGRRARVLTLDSKARASTSARTRCRVCKQAEKSER